MVHIYIKQFRSFYKLRSYVREMKRVGLLYKLVDPTVDAWWRI